MLQLYPYVKYTIQNAQVTIGALLIGVILKHVKNHQLRRWICTIFGVVSLAIMYGEHFWHSFLVYVLTIVSILISGPKKCHIVTLIITLTYMSSFRIIYCEEISGKYFGITLLLMLYMAKMTGVAFDIHFTNTNKEKKKKDLIYNNEYEYDYNTEPKFWDLFHFTFFHIELVSGLFYRYRTYEDYIKTDFSKYFKNYRYVLNRICMTAVFLILYLLIHGRYFPIDYLSMDEFKGKTFWYISFYGMMQGLASRIWMIYLFALGELVCAVSGFGAYPVRGENKQGHGPSRRYDELIRMNNTMAEKEDYDLKTVQNVYLYQLCTTSWVRDMIKAWNMTFQYWVSNMIQISVFTYVGKHDLAFLITMFIDTLWHGVNPGFMFASSMMVIFMISMKHYWKIYQYTKGWVSIVYLITMWLLRECYCLFFSLSCMLYHVEDIHSYFSLIYYTPVLFVVLLYVVGVVTASFMKK